MTPLPVKESPRFFRPRSFLAGLLAGLAALSWLGWRVSRVDYHPGFTRFHPSISPEGLYYPTIAEMSAIVRARCRPGQVLVIVGGNSIFYGVGQPAAEVWTRSLQELLGDRYCVINFAFRGAEPTDGGALVAEVLRDEFPRQVYVANVGVMQGISPTGSDAYRFLFWEAYYKGLLLPYAPRARFVADYFHDNPAARSDRPGLIGGIWFDRLLHFHDLWNYVGVQWINTVPNSYHPLPPEVYWARGRFADDEPDFRDTPFDRRFPAGSRALEETIVRNTTNIYYERTADGHWLLSPYERGRFDLFLKAAMPEALRRRTLMVVSKNSPFYVAGLTPDEQARDKQAYRDMDDIWRGAGYHAVTYPDNFTAADYGDRAHLTVTGGRKLAALVADQVRAIARERGYLAPTP